MANMTAAQTRFCLKNLPVTESILIVGAHGLGKSENVRQVTIEEDMSFIDMRLSQNDVGDMKGMPFHVSGRTFFAPPDWFPLKEEDADELKKFLNLTEAISNGRFGDRGILLLDEINRATREVQQAAFELVLDRRLNMRSLPDGWRVVAAMNGNNNDTDIYSVNEMDPALISRFFVIDFNPSVDEWLEYCNKNNVNESIIQFIRKIPSFLDPTSEILKDAALKGVTKLHDRRSWIKFGRTLTKFEKDYEKSILKTHPLDKKRENLDQLLLIAGGFVGNLAAIKFVNFIETDYQSLDANIILNNWNDEVKERLTKIVNEGRIPELGAYNEDLIAYMDKKLTTKKLSKKQAENLYKYIALLPKEPVADFWMSANEVCSETVEAWYSSNKKHTDIIVKAIMKKTPKKA